MGLGHNSIDTRPSIIKIYILVSGYSTNVKGLKNHWHSTLNKKKKMSGCSTTIVHGTKKKFHWHATLIGKKKYIRCWLKYYYGAWDFKIL